MSDTAWLIESWGILLPYTCARTRRQAIAQYVYNVDTAVYDSGIETCWNELNALQKAAWKRLNSKNGGAKAVKVRLERVK